MYEDLVNIIDEDEQILPNYTPAEDTPAAIVQGNCVSLGDILDPPHPNVNTKIHSTRILNKVYPTKMAPAKLMHPEEKDGTLHDFVEVEIKEQRGNYFVIPLIESSGEIFQGEVS